ncbi:MAG: SGNH/GDSL hydrolase family protein [Coleofasciculaceae cyanobacterium]
MKALLVIVAVVVGLLVSLEVGLRLLGFGRPPLYIADREIGYLLAPNQSTRRFGNRIAINDYSMRSGQTTKERPTSTLRVLLLGDSVANGAWWTDQDDIISVLLSSQLEPLLQNSSGASSSSQTSFESVEVLNASANSWGPRNELAYLKRFGLFGVNALVLLINTDDLFSTAPTSLPVGRDRNYPSSKPPLGIIEALSRLLPYRPPSEMAVVNTEPGDRVGFNLEAIQQIKLLADAADAKFLLAMTPLLREIGEPGPRDYELTARTRLDQFSQEQQISYLDFLPIFNSREAPEKLYRDHIHLSTKGNQTVSEQIGGSLQPLLLPVGSSTTLDQTILQ